MTSGLCSPCAGSGEEWTPADPRAPCSLCRGCGLAVLPTAGESAAQVRARWAAAMLAAGCSV